MKAIATFCAVPQGAPSCRCFASGNTKSGNVIVAEMEQTGDSLSLLKPSNYIPRWRFGMKNEMLERICNQDGIISTFAMPSLHKHVRSLFVLSDKIAKFAHHFIHSQFFFRKYDNRLCRISFKSGYVDRTKQAFTNPRWPSTQLDRITHILAAHHRAAHNPTARWCADSVVCITRMGNPLHNLISQTAM